MSRIYKSKRGFTLVEIVIVIAIIVMLAAVVTFSIAGYMTRGRSGSESLATERETFQSNNAAKNAAFVAAGF
ncbi:MAG: prepilin-type N-terminal cleavage/methylation domain-containing protein [Clostridiales bacterium]|nr:prepilin-type N-terminal cleavage/methylation domain-containing protein [Clostridiales bacterium]MBR5417242.1 prepilin-type N-terminal cleavage/methylation domain-containing protein [Clostridiales bacterium]